jgi:hypothetical protein
MEKYKILNIYKEDQYQKITLACEKENHEKIVILNLLQKKFLPDSCSLLNFRRCIDSLAYSEETDEEIILATFYKKGFPISKYIQYYKPILKTRINFIYEYLDKITNFDCLHIKSANSLIKESQVIIENNDVKFNDILIVNEIFEKKIDFNILCSSIHETLQLFIFSKTNISEEKLKDLPTELQDFLNDLSINKRNYTNLKEIFSDFKNIYLYSLYLDDKNSALLMKDVKSSVASSEEMPIPVYNPINAFGLKQDHNINEKVNISEEEKPNGDSTVEANVDKGVFLDDYLSGIINNSNEGPEIIKKTDEVVLPDGDNSENLSDGQTTEEIADENVLTDDYISDDSDNLNDEQTVEEVTDEGTLTDEYISDDPDDLGDEQTVEEITNDTFDQEDEDDIDIMLHDYENDYADIFKPIDSYFEPIPELTTQKNNKKDRKVIAIILIAALLGIILTVCSKTDLLFFKDNLPVATFQHERLYDEWIFRMDNSETVFQSYEWAVKQNEKDVLSDNTSELRFKETFLEEGEFTVSLRILDDENNWSKTYSNNYYNIVNDIDTININPNSDQNKEQFDSLSVQYQDKGSISKDDTVFRNGTYSLQISGNNQNEESKLSISNLVMDNDSVISMWILSDSTEPFNVQLLGYTGKNLAFKRSVNFKPSSKNYWELLSVSQETNNVDRMEIVFSNMSSRIWIDDLDINSYK